MFILENRAYVFGHSLVKYGHSVLYGRSIRKGLLYKRELPGKSCFTPM